MNNYLEERDMATSRWPCPPVGFWVQQPRQQHHSNCGVRVVTSFLVLIISWKLDAGEEAVEFARDVNGRVDGLFVQESDDGGL